MKKPGFVGIFAAILLSCSYCGKVDFQTTRGLISKAPYQITITVNINANDDPTIYIRTNDFEIDRTKREITIKGLAYLSNVADTTERDASFAIQIENAKFSLPLGGKITIEKDGHTEVLEYYP